MRRVKYEDMVVGEYYLLQNIAGTDWWAIGKLHSIDDLYVNLQYDDDCLNEIFIENVKDYAHIYQL